MSKRKRKRRRRRRRKKKKKIKIKRKRKMKRREDKDKEASAGEGVVADSVALPCILVHCASGVSRSVATCCAWLMTRQGYMYQDALHLIRKNRPHANPNMK